MWELHSGTLVFALHFNLYGISIVGIKIKYRLLSNHLFQRTYEYGGWKEPQDNNYLLLKTTSFSYHLSKQLVPISHTGGKGFRSCCTFDGLRVNCFPTEQKTCNILQSVWVFLGFLEKRKPSEYCFQEN